MQPSSDPAESERKYQRLRCETRCINERRLRASRRAGLKAVPAYIREATTEEILEMAIVENVQREDLNPIEVALGYQRLIEEVGLTQEQVAEKVSKSRPAVANALRLLRLPPRVQASLREGTVTAGHARMLVSIDDEDAQLALHREILDDGLSVREVERRVRAMREAEQDTAAEPSTTAQKAAEKTAALTERDRLQVESFEGELREKLAAAAESKRVAYADGIALGERGWASMLRAMAPARPGSPSVPWPGGRRVRDVRGDAWETNRRFRASVRPRRAV